MPQPTKLVTVTLTEQEALLICDVLDGQPFGSLIRMAGLTITQRIRAQVADQTAPPTPSLGDLTVRLTKPGDLRVRHPEYDGRIRQELILPKYMSTRRLDLYGFVHEMAESGVGSLCATALPEPWIWTEKKVNCKMCKRIMKAAKRSVDSSSVPS